MLPPEVQCAGLDAFECLGEDVSEVVEHRPSSFVVVRTVRPKFVAKAKLEEMAATSIPEGTPEHVAVASTPVLQAPALELPIPRGLCGPGLLADTIVRRWNDHLPLHRLERIYGREGLELARSTVCGWHCETALLLTPLIDATWKDALANSPYICTDATGVLVQAQDKCRRAHFFVVIAPGSHVLFGYTPKHNSAAVDELLKDYKGFLVADAHSVYDRPPLREGRCRLGCMLGAFETVLVQGAGDGRHACSPRPLAHPGALQAGTRVRHRSARKEAATARARCAPPRRGVLPVLRRGSREGAR